MGISKKQTYVVPDDADRKRLDMFLADAVAGLTRSGMRNLLKAGLVTVDGKPEKPSHRLKGGESVEVMLPPAPSTAPAPENIPLEILYEDDDIIVVNKQAGLVVHPGAGRTTGTLAGALLHHTKKLSTLGGEDRPGIVHRLDRDTTGLIVAAKNDASHASLASQFKAHTTKRAYVSLVWGAPDNIEGTIDMPIGRDVANRKRISPRSTHKRSAVTHYKVLRSYPFLSLVELRLDTGRTHQIRVHLAAVNHPVVGDRVYGRRTTPSNMPRPVADAVKKIQRQCLHAKSLGFTHPGTGEYVEFSAPMPEDMAELVRVLEEAGCGK